MKFALKLFVVTLELSISFENCIVHSSNEINKIKKTKTNDTFLHMDIW